MSNIFSESSETDRYKPPGLGSWFECDSRANPYSEFKTALNAEIYLDCLKQEAFRKCLVRVRLGISNLNVHKNRYARGDVLPDNAFVPWFSFTWWGCCGLCFWHEPTELSHSFLSMSVFMAPSTVFHSVKSPDNSPLSHYVLPVLLLPYRSFQLYISLQKSPSALI